MAGSEWAGGGFQTTVDYISPPYDQTKFLLGVHFGKIGLLLSEEVKCSETPAPIILYGNCHFRSDACVVPVYMCVHSFHEKKKYIYILHT